MKLKLLSGKFHGPWIKMCLKHCKAVLHLEVQSCASTTLMRELLFHRGGVFLFLTNLTDRDVLVFQKADRFKWERRWFCIIVVSIFHWKYKTRQNYFFKLDNCKSNYEKDQDTFSHNLYRISYISLKCIHSFFFFFVMLGNYGLCSLN